MLKKLTIHNFKSWQNTGEMPLASLTGLFGTNSSGKTGIIQLLLMLKQTVESPDRQRVLHTGDDKTYIDLGRTYATGTCECGKYPRLLPKFITT